MSSEVNLEKLIKLIRLSESSNDAEALAALRAANALLKRAGWDWEKLLRGKVTVVADPFSNIPAPPPATSMRPPARLRLLDLHLHHNSQGLLPHRNPRGEGAPRALDLI
jgi:hypothetical protein